ncbi:Holliday junction resolvase RecU [Bacillaceae bacterium Marseille-Q3522]|nr:Holliday junction resolvase RecU [Bacillaceae bacterium Marseille-Q3522]
MEFHYPNGKRYLPEQDSSYERDGKKQWSHSNRGMTFEEDINETNEYYLNNGIAVIHKKPTPVQIVQVDYPKRSAAVITEAYFKQASTTDYNGIYQGKYIDFEAKETKNRLSFPLKNFHKHQIEHMERIIEQQGISFVLFRFSASDEMFLLEAGFLLHYWKRMEQGGRKSITKAEIAANGYELSLGFQPRIDYIKIVDKLIHRKPHRA